MNAVTRIASLEAKFEERLVEEAQDIRETEANLLRRKRSIHEAMQSMPTQTRSRISLGDDTQGASDMTSNNNACVVCHDESALMAVVSCGHVCLCSSCSDACTSNRTGSRVCALCFRNIQTVLRIYMGR